MNQKSVNLSAACFQELVQAMDPEDRFIDAKGGIVLTSNSGNILHITESSALARAEKNYSDYVDCLERGDLEGMRAISRRTTGRTYGDVVSTMSEQELQRRIDVVNRARGVL